MRSLSQEAEAGRLRSAFEIIRKSAFATTEEVVRAERVMNEKLRAMSDAAARGATGFTSLQTAADSANGTIARVSVTTGTLGGSLQRVFEIATGFNLANVFDSLVSGAIRATKELITLGFEVQRQEQAFDRLTRVFGVNGQALAAEVERMSQGLVSASDVMITMASALQEGLRPEQLVRLAEVAIEQSKLMGTTVTEAYKQILDAVVRLEERGLKQAKIFIDTKTVLDAYAKSLGTTEEKLTDVERRQAIMTATLEKAEKQIRDMGGVVVDATQKIEQQSVKLQNWREGIAKNFSAAAEAAVSWATTTVTSVNRVAEAFGKFQEGGGIFAWLGQQLGLVGAAVEKMGPFNQMGPTRGGADLGVNRQAAAPPSRPPTDAELRAAESAAKKAADEIRRMDELLASASQKLTGMANAFQSEDAKKISDISDYFENLARRAEEFGAKGAPIAAKIREIGRAAVAIEERVQAWKDTVKALDDMDQGLQELKAPLTAAGDLATRFALTGDDVTFSLGGATTAVITFGQAFKTMAQPIEEVTAAFGPFLSEMTGIEKAQRDFQISMAQNSALANVLGSDFDFAGARIAALRTQAQELARVSGGDLTPELQKVGAELRQALADQSLYQSIEKGFLSITDTFTKMADGLIQGTLDIGDAFANLGRNLLTNFVQVVLHQVFDPILKEAASFVSGLIGILTGRGGLISGTGGSAALGLVGAVGGAFGFGNNFSTEQVAAMMQGGGAAAGGTGSGTLGTLSGISSGLTTLYGVVAKITGLPSLLDLTASGLSSLGVSLSILAPTIDAATVSAIGLAAAAGSAAGGAGAAAGAGVFAGGVGAGLSALAGPAAMLGIPLLLGFLDTLGKAEIARENIERRRAQAGFDVNLENRLRAAETGVLSPADLQTFHNDIGIMLQSAKFQATPTLGRTPDELEGPAFNATETAQAFVRAAEAAGYQPVAQIDLGQGPMSTLSQASVDLLQRYIDLLDKGVESWGRAAEVATPDFDRAGVIDELMADLPRIALILDLPALQREGEDVAETFQRMVTALSGLDVMLQRLSVDAAVLRGDLDVPALLASNLDKVTKAMDAANIALASTGDPEQIRASAEQLETLTHQSFQMIFDSIEALVGKLREELGSAASGLVGLAQAAPVLRELGIEVGGMSAGLADVVDLLGEVGDTAGQLSILRGAVGAFGAEVAGANPATILASAQAFTRSLAATAQGVNALTDAQQRMAGLTEILGDLTQGYEAAAAAVTAHFEALREAEQQGLDESIRLSRSYYDAQRSALTNLVASSRQFEASARRIRDQVAAFRTSDLSPLNPADQLSVARQQLGAALETFWRTPAADVADDVSALAGRVLELGASVHTRVAPAFELLSTEVVGILEAVAAAVEDRVTPEEESVRLLAEINAREAKTLESLGVVVDTNQAMLDQISGGLTVFDPAAESWLSSVVAQGRASKDALEALAAEQAAVTESLRSGFGAVAQQVVGTTAAVWSDVAGTYLVNDTLHGIWGTLGTLWAKAEETRGDLHRLLSDLAQRFPSLDVSSINTAIDGLKAAQALALDLLGANVRAGLEALVGSRLDAIYQQGGTQAVVDALASDGPIAGAVRASGQNIFYAIRDLSAHLGLQGYAPPRVSFERGTFYAPGGPAIIHPGEVVVPASKSAAAWVREGGFMASGTVTKGPDRPAVPVTINQTIQDARDPELTAEIAARKVIRYLNTQHGMRL